MARTYLRFLIAIPLAVAFAQLPCELAVRGMIAPIAGVAHGQVIPDPGFGDPYATGGFGDARPGTGANGVMNPPVSNNFGPMAPATPGSPTRPPGWPGGSGTQAPAPVYAPGSTAGPAAGYRMATALPPPAVTAPPAAPKKSPADPPYDPAEIVAHVGTEVIQASEVLPMVNLQMAAVMKQHAAELAAFSPEERDEQLNPLRREMMKRALDENIKVKLLLGELRNKAPAEGLAKQEKLIREYFNSHEIKRMMDEHKATSIIDLENKLRALGSSLDSQRNVFVERQLAGAWLNENTKKEPQPATHEQLLTYYREHTVDWQSPSRVRWEQLTVKFANFSSKREAYSALARWGNEIMRGAPFAAVAKAHSQDIAAEDGGRHDWASQGSLRSTVLDAALFSLPEGALSQILEDEDGFHIVRVVQREAARQAPFTDVQREIKTTLQATSKERRQIEYLEKLRQHVQVSTIFDDDFVARTSQPAGPVVR